jgi:hypothetical protein
MLTRHRDTRNPYRVLHGPIGRLIVARFPYLRFHASIGQLKLSARKEVVNKIGNEE